MLLVPAVTSPPPVPGNPQTENGFLRIATELHAALCRTRIPGEARQVFDAIVLKTYGFNKKEDAISLSQFEAATGLSRAHVCRAITLLLSMNIIAKSGTTALKKYAVNKAYGSWRGECRKSTKDTSTKDTEGAADAAAAPAAEVVDEYEAELRKLIPFASDILGFPKLLTPEALTRWKGRRRRWSTRELAQAFANLRNEPDRWKIKNNGHPPARRPTPYRTWKCRRSSTRLTSVSRIFCCEPR